MKPRPRVIKGGFVLIIAIINLSSIIHENSKPKLQPSEIYSSQRYTESVDDDPLIRVMALHALLYCERLYYLEEVERIQLADKNIYAGRTLHEGIGKSLKTLSVVLASEDLGIKGKVDFVRKQSGKLTVYEHKKGRSKEGTEAWPSDRIQVLAYALLLEEHTDESVQEARIRYHGDKKTIIIPVIFKEAEKEVKDAVARAIELRNLLKRPPVTVSEYQCRKCSLAPVCLPEEERFLNCGKEKPERLFPPEDDRKIVHFVDQGSSIRKKAEQLIVSLNNGEQKALPGKNISSLVLHGNVQISTQAIHFCAANDIGIHWLSYGGYYVGALSPSAGAVQRKNRQYKAFQNPSFRLNLALRLSKAKSENQFRYLLRSTRSNKNSPRSSNIDKGLAKIKSEIKSIDQYKDELNTIAKDIKLSGLTIKIKNRIESLSDSIRGHEGMASKLYFGLLPSVMNLNREDFLYFEGRNRRPPKDPFNALLSFGYSLLYRDCVSSLLAVGLDPAFGFYHTARSYAYPLALDLMELFRVILWDIPLIGSVNRKQWSKDDFNVTNNQVWLNTSGRKKAIQLYENRKKEKWKHPVLEYSLSYSRALELEARLLEKEWTAKPGLFAKLRVR